MPPKRVRRPKEYPLVIREGSAIVTIYRVFISGADRYQIRWSQFGVIKRRTVSDEAQAALIAEETAKNLNAGIHGSLMLDPATAAEYERVKALCGGVPMVQAVQEWADVRGRLGATPLSEAVNYYLARHGGKSAPVRDVVNEFKRGLLAKNVSETYIVRISWRLTRIADFFTDRNIQSITEQEIRAFVDAQGGSDRTRKNMRDAIVTVWRWARDGGYLPRDLQTEAERVKAPKIRKKAKIEIFTPKEIKVILDSAPDHVRPAIAICAFAGVRSHGEITRLQWAHFLWDRGVIDVSTVDDGDGGVDSVSKTGDRRLIPIHPNLREWLQGCKDKSGAIITLEKPDEAYRRAAQAAGVQWRHNALRHSYGSYRVAQTKSIDQTSLEMGNSPAMIKRHYLEAVHEDEATAWFSVVPG